MDIEEKMKRLDAFAIAAMAAMIIHDMHDEMNNASLAGWSYQVARFMEAERERVLGELKKEAGL